MDMMSRAGHDQQDGWAVRVEATALTTVLVHDRGFAIDSTPIERTNEA